MVLARLNGIDIAYDDAGRGPDVLVFVHGHPFDRRMWRGQAAHFSQVGWRVIAPDLRGYGESVAAPGAVTLETFAEDLAALLDHLRVDRAGVVGLSMGGQIVMEFCRSFAERVRGVGIVATFPQAESQEGRRSRHATADRILAEGMHAYAEELLPKMLGARTIAEAPAVASFVLDMMRNAPAAGAAAALRGRAERIDYGATLSAIRVPAIIVIGDQDAFTSRADAERMHDLVRGSELVWMKDVGHMPNLEAEAAFNSALQAFLDRVRAAGA